MRAFWLLGLMLLGCDKLDAMLPALQLNTATPSAMLLEHDDARIERKPVSPAERNRLHHDLRKLRNLWTFNAEVPTADLPICKDVALSGSDASSPILAYVDARAQTKSLIPRRVAERLESGGLAEVRSNDEDPPAEEDAPNALRTLLSAWESRRYAFVFYVTQYSGPALILRVGELRRSWYPGTLAAKLALYDVLERRPVCGYSLHVHNETKDAPIRARLQAETRMRLERELAVALVETARNELARDMPNVVLP